MGFGSGVNGNDGLKLIINHIMSIKTLVLRPFRRYQCPLQAKVNLRNIRDHIPLRRFIRAKPVLRDLGTSIYLPQAKALLVGEVDASHRLTQVLCFIRNKDNNCTSPYATNALNSLVQIETGLHLSLHEFSLKTKDASS